MPTPPETSRTDAPALLITAGPTHEPIDAVRYLANRSSGRVGCALADAALTLGWRVTLLLGPAPQRPRTEPNPGQLEIVRFRTAQDLQTLLQQHLGDHDALIMAAAVADYRPAAPPTEAKLRRTGERLTLDFEPVPDLLAGCAQNRRPGQVLVGFALEPRASLHDSARAKLERKGIDLIVANPLETMDADEIDAALLARPELSAIAGTPGAGPVPKTEFAAWLIDRVGRALAITRKDADAPA